MGRKLLYLTFFSILVLGLLHQAGSYFFLYWSLSWFDAMMHFLGGLSLSLLFIWWRFSRKSVDAPQMRDLLWSTFVFIVVVGAMWEVFEYVYDVANPAHQSYNIDTIQDMVFDVLGGLLAVFVGKSKKFYE